MSSGDEEVKSSRNTVQKNRRKSLIKSATKSVLPIGIRPSEALGKLPENMNEGIDISNPTKSQQNIKEWLVQIGITKTVLIDAFYQKFKESSLDKNSLVSYWKMCEFFHCDDSKMSRFVYVLFANKETETIDLRKCLCALACLLFTSLREVLKFEFELFDHDKSRYITDDDLLALLHANHFVSNQIDVVHKTKTILEHSQNFAHDKTLSEEEFFQLALEMPDLFFLNPLQ